MSEGILGDPCFWVENGGGFWWGILGTLDIELK